MDIEREKSGPDMPVDPAAPEWVEDLQRQVQAWLDERHIAVGDLSVAVIGGRLVIGFEPHARIRVVTEQAAPAPDDAFAAALAALEPALDLAKSGVAELECPYCGGESDYGGLMLRITRENFGSHDDDLIAGRLSRKDTAGGGAVLFCPGCGYQETEQSL